jgi:hypothetical protein
MRGFLSVVVVVIVALLAAPATCAAGPGWPRLAALDPVSPPGPQGILPGRQEPKVDTQQAAARVRRAYADHKILSVQLIDARGPPVYRVKTLSGDGVVKNVFVDGVSGQVFE